MQVHLPHVVERDFEDLADAQVADALARRRQVVELEHRHVAAVAAAPLDQPSGGGVLLHGRDDLEERVAEAEDRIPQPEVAHARIGERLAQPEPFAQLAGDSVEVAGSEDGLAKPKHPRHPTGGCSSSPSPQAGLMF